MLETQIKKRSIELELVKEDHDIKALYQNNPRQAFDRLVTKYMRLLFYHAYHMLKDYEEAKDVSQEVFLKAFQNSYLFTEAQSIKAWLIRVLSNQCIDYLRIQGVKRKYEDLLIVEETQLSFEDHVMNNEDKEILIRRLDQLPPLYKNIVVLRYFDELSYSEIASILECEMGTVMSRLNRAKKLLEEEFKHV